MKEELVKRIVDLVEDCMSVAGIEEGRTLTERDVEDFLGCVERALREIDLEDKVGDEELEKKVKYLTELTLRYLTQHPKVLVETIVQLCEYTDPEDAIRRFVALVEEFHRQRLKYEET